jgi:hypothetical protein
VLGPGAGPQHRVVQGGSAMVALLAVGWTLERAFVIELLP